MLTGPKSGSKRNTQTVEPVIAGVAQAPSAAIINASRGSARMRVSRTARAHPTNRVASTQAVAKSTVARSTCQNWLSLKRVA